MQEFYQLVNNPDLLFSTGMGQTRQLMIPAAPVEYLDGLDAGRWNGELKRMAHESIGYMMPAECLTTATNRKHKQAVLFFHGGAYVSGTLDQYRRTHLLVSQLSGGLPVYGFAYRLAPGSQYPTQLYDALSAYHHLTTKEGYRPEDILFMGDSAGGNLAIGLWRLMKPPILGMVLVSPRVDVRSHSDSWKQVKNDILDIYDLKDPQCSVNKLLSQPEEMLMDPYVSPVFAKDLEQMPATLVQAARAEAMYDDIREFVRVARNQTTQRVEWQTLAGGFHDFQMAPMVMKSTRQARLGITAFIHPLLSE